MQDQLIVDRFVAILAAPFAVVILAILYLIVVPLQGRPFLYTSERMRSRDQAFLLLKIRTMHPPDLLAEQSALGGVPPLVREMPGTLRK